MGKMIHVLYSFMFRLLHFIHIIAVHQLPEDITITGYLVPRNGRSRGTHFVPVQLYKKKFEKKNTGGVDIPRGKEKST